MFFRATTSIIGGGQLMPEPEFQSLIASSGSGFVRQDGSRALTRLLHDLEWKAPTGKGRLCVTILHSHGRGGEPKGEKVAARSLRHIPGFEWSGGL
jgi:hypothetical protein